MDIFFSFDGESFKSAASSKCDHFATMGLANYRGMALTTGSLMNSDCYVRTEVYNFKTNQWTDALDYPFASLVNHFLTKSINILINLF